MFALVISDLSRSSWIRVCFCLRLCYWFILWNWILAVYWVFYHVIIIIKNNTGTEVLSGSYQKIFLTGFGWESVSKQVNKIENTYQNSRNSDVLWIPTIYMSWCVEASKRNSHYEWMNDSLVLKNRIFHLFSRYGSFLLCQCKRLGFCIIWE